MALGAHGKASIAGDAGGVEVMGFERPDQRAGQHFGIRGGVCTHKLAQRSEHGRAPRGAEHVLQHPRGAVMHRAATGAIDPAHADDHR